MTFFGFLAWLGAVEGGAGEAVPAGTRLSVLAFELPRSITPTVAGLTVGAFVGVVGFTLVMLLVGRGQRRPSRRAPRMVADQVVFIPPYAPYGSLQRETPMPPQAFATPSRAQGMPGFVPSTELSARAFAKMRYDADAEYAPQPQPRRDAPDADPSVFFEVDMLDEDDLVPSNTPAPGSAAVSVSPVVVLSAPARSRDDESNPGEVRAADKSAPHPLGIIKSTSVAMRAAPIADLAFDDGPTEIGETYFDEPPQPRRRTDPPRIRAVRPAAPRFPQPTEQTPLLPQVTPPPVRVAPGSRSQSSR